MISRVDQRKVTQVSSEGGGVLHRVTFLLWVAFSAQWKLAVKNRSRPTKRLLRVKTSATMDHCQPSLDTANSPPARTAPGPGPASLTVTEHTDSVSLGSFFTVESLQSFGLEMNLLNVIVKEMSHFQDFRTFFWYFI